MTEKQHERIVKAVFLSPFNCTEANQADGSEQRYMSKCLRHLIIQQLQTQMLQMLYISFRFHHTYLADKVWSESTKILSNKDSVCLSTGCTNQCE